MQSGGTSAVADGDGLDIVAAGRVGEGLTTDSPFIAVASLGSLFDLGVGVDGQVQGGSGGAAVGIGDGLNLVATFGVGEGLAGNIPGVGFASHCSLFNILKGIDGQRQCSSVVLADTIDILVDLVATGGVGTDGGAIEDPLVLVADGNSLEGGVDGVLDSQVESGDAVAAVGGATIAIDGNITALGEVNAVPFVGVASLGIGVLVDLVVDGQVEGNNRVATHGIAVGDGVLDGGVGGIGFSIDPGVGVANDGVERTSIAVVYGNGDLVGAGAIFHAGVVVSVGAASGEDLGSIVGPSHLVAVASSLSIEDGAAAVVDGQRQGDAVGADAFLVLVNHIVAFGEVEGGTLNGPVILVASNHFGLGGVDALLDGQNEVSSGRATSGFVMIRLAGGGIGGVDDILATRNLPCVGVASGNFVVDIGRGDEGQDQGVLLGATIGIDCFIVVCVGDIIYIGITVDLPGVGRAAVHLNFGTLLLVDGQVEGMYSLATIDIGEVDIVHIALGERFCGVCPVEGEASFFSLLGVLRGIDGYVVVDIVIHAEVVGEGVVVNAAGGVGSDSIFAIHPDNLVTTFLADVLVVHTEDSLEGGVVLDKERARVVGVAVVPLDEVEACVGSGGDVDDVTIGVGAGADNITTGIAVGGQGNVELLITEVGGVGDVDVIVGIENEGSISAGVVAGPVGEVVAILGIGDDSIVGVGLAAGNGEVHAVGSKELIILVVHFDITHLLHRDSDVDCEGLIIEVGGEVTVAFDIEAVAGSGGDNGVVVIIVGPVDKLVSSVGSGSDCHVGAVVDTKLVGADITHGALAIGNGGVDVILFGIELSLESDIGIGNGDSAGGGGNIVVPLAEGVVLVGNSLDINLSAIDVLDRIAGDGLVGFGVLDVTASGIADGEGDGMGIDIAAGYEHAVALNAEAEGGILGDQHIVAVPPLPVAIVLVGGSGEGGNLAILVGTVGGKTGNFAVGAGGLDGVVHIVEHGCNRGIAHNAVGEGQSGAIDIIAINIDPLGGLIAMVGNSLKGDFLAEGDGDRSIDSSSAIGNITADGFVDIDGQGIGVSLEVGGMSGVLGTDSEGMGGIGKKRVVVPVDEVVTVVGGSGQGNSAAIGGGGGTGDSTHLGAGIGDNAGNLELTGLEGGGVGNVGGGHREGGVVVEGGIGGGAVVPADELVTGNGAGGQGNGGVILGLSGAGRNGTHKDIVANSGDIDKNAVEHSYDVGILGEVEGHRSKLGAFTILEVVKHITGSGSGGDFNTGHLVVRTGAGEGCCCIGRVGGGSDGELADHEGGCPGFSSGSVESIGVICNGGGTVAPALELIAVVGGGGQGYGSTVIDSLIGGRGNRTVGVGGGGDGHLIDSEGGGNIDVGLNGLGAAVGSGDSVAPGDEVVMVGGLGHEMNFGTVLNHVASGNTIAIDGAHIGIVGGIDNAMAVESEESVERSVGHQDNSALGIHDTVAPALEHMVSVGSGGGEGNLAGVLLDTALGDSTPCGIHMDGSVVIAGDEGLQHDIAVTEHGSDGGIAFDGIVIGGTSAQNGIAILPSYELVAGFGGGNEGMDRTVFSVIDAGLVNITHKGALININGNIICIGSKVGVILNVGGNGGAGGGGAGGIDDIIAGPVHEVVVSAGGSGERGGAFVSHVGGSGNGGSTVGSGLSGKDIDGNSVVDILIDGLDGHIALAHGELVGGISVAVDTVDFPVLESLAADGGGGQGEGLAILLGARSRGGIGGSKVVGGGGGEGLDGDVIGDGEAIGGIGAHNIAADFPTCKDILVGVVLAGGEGGRGVVAV